MTRSSRFHCLIGVINKPTTDELRISPVNPVEFCGNLWRHKTRVLGYRVVCVILRLADL